MRVQKENGGRDHVADKRPEYMTEQKHLRLFLPVAIAMHVGRNEPPDKLVHPFNGRLKVRKHARPQIRPQQTAE